MILYQVTVDVDKKIWTAYQDWLRTHVKEMLMIDGFESAEILYDMEEGHRVVIQYRLVSPQAMDFYLDNHAARMRRDALQHFSSECFRASRMILSSQCG